MEMKVSGGNGAFGFASSQVPTISNNPWSLNNNNVNLLGL